MQTCTGPAGSLWFLILPVGTWNCYSQVEVSGALSSSSSSSTWQILILDLRLKTIKRVLPKRRRWN